MVHHFTLPYCPWTNVKVEVVCKELMRLFRALNSGFQIPFDPWPSVLLLVQSVLNNTPSRRIGGRCTLTAFRGLSSDNPLHVIRMEIAGKIETLRIKDVRARQLVMADNHSQALKTLT